MKKVTYRILKQINKFDPLEREYIKRSVKNGDSVLHGIRVVINTVEGDYSQLSDEAKKYIKFFDKIDRFESLNKKRGVTKWQVI